MNMYVCLMALAALTQIFAVDRINGERIYQHASFSWASLAASMSLIRRVCVGVPQRSSICSSGWTTFTRLPSERRMRLF